MPINVVDFANTQLESIQSVDESSTIKRDSIHNLTVRDGKVQITTISPFDTIDGNLRTAIGTGTSGEHKKATVTLSPSNKPNLRYVVKEETPLLTAGSRNSNEDLLCFSRGLVVQTA